MTQHESQKCDGISAICDALSRQRIRSKYIRHALRHFWCRLSRFSLEVLYLRRWVLLPALAMMDWFTNAFAGYSGPCLKGRANGKILSGSAIHQEMGSPTGIGNDGLVYQRFRGVLWVMPQGTCKRQYSLWKCYTSGDGVSYRHWQ